MTESKMDGFFNALIEQHWDVMKDEPHVCSAFRPKRPPRLAESFC